MSTDDPRDYTPDTRSRAERLRDLRDYLLGLAPSTRPVNVNRKPETHAETMSSLTRIHPAALDDRLDDRNARKRERRGRRQ